MRTIAAALLTLALFFVWSIPGVPALRHLLHFLALLLLARVSMWRELANRVRDNRWPLRWLILITLWFLVQAVLISPETYWALGELNGQWGIALLAGLLGFFIAQAAMDQMATWGSIFTTALAAILILQAAIAVYQSVDYWFTHGELLRVAVPLTGGKLEMSYILNILLAALTVDLFFRASHGSRFLHLPTAMLVFSLATALFAQYIAGARNGIIGVIFLSVSATTLFFLETRRSRRTKRAITGATLLITAVAVFACVSYQSDARWQSFSQSVRAGWDIDGNRTWRDSDHLPYPTQADGRPVDDSAYLRVAFIHAGLRLIAEHPLGVGYGRNAFAHAFRQDGEIAHVGHAHSGWIDLGIGGGYPAIVLWAAFLSSLMLAGWVRYSRRGDPHGLWLLLLTAGYAGRMLLDSVNRDHMLLIFFFLSGYLLLMSSPDAASRHHPGNSS